MEQSLRRLRRLEAQAEEGEPLRVSDSEADARKMKQADGGWAPSYKVQISTELKNLIIVGIRVSDQAGDHQELAPCNSGESREAGALKVWRREAGYGPAAFRMAEGT